MTKYKVGQLICIQGDEYEVTSVGRKYAEYARPGMNYSAGKFELSTELVVRKNGARPRAYQSRAAYSDQLALELAWKEVHAYVRNRHVAPEHLTLTAVNNILSALKGM